MREIKFRAWQKSYRAQMRYWEELVVEHGEPSISKSFEDQDMIFMQYTGTKDKNGKEIYEGDILKCTDHVASVQYGHYDSYCGMGLSVIGYGFHVSKNERTPFMIGENCEIIGNIYENPELIPK